MDLRIFDHIGNEMWKEEKKFRKDKENTHIVKVEKEFYKELNALGYKFYWHMQFSYNTFTAEEKAVIPIVIKYLDKIEDSDSRGHFMYCLGVKGFYDATEYVLNEYEKSLIPPGDYSIQSVAPQVIEKIQDPRYIDRYLSFLNRENMEPEIVHFIEMLGRMKVERAIPPIIKHIEGEGKIRDSYYGTNLEYMKYLVSQSAIRALGRFKNPEHIKYVEKFIEPEKIPWIQFPDTKERKYLLKTTYKTYKSVAERAIKKMSAGLKKEAD